MSEVSPGETKPDAAVPGSGPAASRATGESLAARLLAAHRVLAALNVAPDVRLRLHLRFMAICTSLKLPGGSPARCARRLDRLMADITRADGDRGAGV